MNRITLKRIGPIKRARLPLGDLTVFVGPQASGKSIALQWIKLIDDLGFIQDQLKTYGIDYDRDLDKFLEVYFGEGMSSIWRERSELFVNHKKVDLQSRIERKQRGKKESVFLIPAQRVIALANGWPRPFQDYRARDPYTVRAYSEELRRLMEREFNSEEILFPKANRLKADYRELLKDSVFGNFALRIDSESIQKRLVLETRGASLPYMVWSAGQRELVPLLLGLYWLMPPGKVSRRKNIKHVIIEELEMGLHPRAISVVLLIVLELLARGYRVSLSTHSPQVLELVWALGTLKKNGGSASSLLEIFGVESGPSLRAMARKVLSKEYKVHFFNSNGQASDISSLEFAEGKAGTNWGGLLDFSANANAAVAKSVSDSN